MEVALLQFLCAAEGSCSREPKGYPQIAVALPFAGPRCCVPLCNGQESPSPASSCVSSDYRSLPSQLELCAV